VVEEFGCMKRIEVEAVLGAAFHCLKQRPMPDAGSGREGAVSRGGDALS
jgi:hypothetical protein